jgi:hypothetical protein
MNWCGSMELKLHAFLITALGLRGCSAWQLGSVAEDQHMLPVAARIESDFSVGKPMDYGISSYY